MSRPISEVWYEAATNWVELEGAANLLEETRSAVLSQMMARCGDVPVSRAEQTVKATPEWEDHVRKVVAARTAANKAKIKVDFLKMRFWEKQSAAATERMEAKL